MVSVPPVPSVLGVIPLKSPPPASPSAAGVGIKPTRANAAKSAPDAASGTQVRAGPTAQFAEAAWATLGPIALSAGASTSRNSRSRSSNSSRASF